MPQTEEKPVHVKVHMSIESVIRDQGSRTVPVHVDLLLSGTDVLAVEAVAQRCGEGFEEALGRMVGGCLQGLFDGVTLWEIVRAVSSGEEVSR